MHHAYLLVGSTTFIDTELSEKVTEAPIDCVSIVLPKLGINDVRALKEQAERRPLMSGYRVIIIRTEAITHEAQNALLKLFEDPSPSTRFILALPRDTLLGTLRSRLSVIAEPNPETASAHFIAQEFCNNSYDKRLNIVAELAKRKDDETMRTLSRALVSTYANTRDTELLADLLLISKFSEQRGASKKMLLDQLALSLPLSR